VSSAPVKNEDATALKSRLDSATLLLTLIDGFGFGNWLREPLPETIGD
jgi:hypothetical protein